MPDTWSGQQIIAHIGSATSNLYLWVNGRFAGYSEDSKLPAEFDITRFLKPGRNLLAMQVFRWSDGSYLEDQDFFRLSGIARESYLYARDKRHIANVRLDAKLSENYTRGTLDVELEFSAAAKGCTAEAALSAPDGKILAVRTVKISGTTTRLTLDAGRVQPWSAEMPALYSVTVSLKNTAGETLEAIPLNTGFREIGIEDGQFRINGQPVLIKGANRHEMDPDGGYVVSRERMLEDIRISMKTTSTPYAPRTTRMTLTGTSFATATDCTSSRKRTSNRTEWVTATQRWQGTPLMPKPIWNGTNGT